METLEFGIVILTAIGIPLGESGNPFYLKFLDSRFHGNDI